MTRPIRIIIFGLLLISGIILTGSDSPVFPWPNIGGVLSTAAAVLIAQHIALEEDDEAEQT
ncbi:MAG TPA: hypothetical protein VKN73_12825 [Desulfosalsimonadaceae bacterium]|nr:hypothetical protein [Desulfosalsimonadaceae bacterium]